VIVLTGLLSFARVTAIHKYYHAPFNVYHHLQTYELPRLALFAHPELAPAIDPTLPQSEFADALYGEQALEITGLKPLNLRLCLGKEWHRFGSSWQVPDELETRFVRSAFDGILPKVWEEPGEGKGLLGRATAVEPTGMNMFNEEEVDRYVRLSLPFFPLLFFPFLTSTFLLRRSTPLPAPTSSTSTTPPARPTPSPPSNPATRPPPSGRKPTATPSSTPLTLPVSTAL
jgi:alpha-1,2-mannosyltransferase